MKKILAILFAAQLVGCGSNTQTVDKKDDGPKSTTNTSSVTDPNDLKGLDLTCSSSGSGNTLICTAGQTITLPATFPPSTLCNQCLTNISSATPPVASVECPNGFGFSYTLVAGATGATGAAASCTVTSAGHFSCSDGSSYQIPPGAQGPKGDTGATGAKGDPGATGATGPQGIAGVGCSMSQNAYGQQVMTCGTQVTVLNGCGGGGCWSYGANGNVYTLPTTTTTLPNFASLTPQETVQQNNYSNFNSASSAGWPTDPARQTWFGILFTGFLQVPVCPSSTCWYRLTSDDGSAFIIDNELVVNNDGLHSSAAVAGSVLAAPGWHTYQIQYFQGPPTQLALALEVSTDGGHTYSVVVQDQLKYLISP